MKGFRGTLVFAVIVAAVVALAVWKYKQGKQVAQQKTFKAKLFPGFKSDNVEELDVTSTSGSYTIKKTGDQWHIVAPFSDVANGDAVQSDLSGIFTQVVKQEENGKTINWKPFGLDKPQMTFEFHFAGGKTQSIQVGSVRTYDDGYYLRRNNEPDLLVGNRGWDTSIGKKADNFRYMKPEIPGGDLTAVRISSSRKDKQFNFTIVDKHGLWIDMKKPEIRFATPKVNTWINSIRDMVAETVASETKSPKDIEKFKLNRPEIVIEGAYDNPPKVWHKIAISALKDGEVYWYTSDNPAIYKMDSNNTVPLLKNLEDLRDHRFVFVFDQTRAEHVLYKQVTNASSGHKGAKPIQPLTIALDKVNGKWQLHTPDSTKEVNQQGVQDFLAYLRNLRAAKFLDRNVPAALRENEVVIKNAADKTIYRLQFGGSITSHLKGQAKIEYYAAKSSDANEFFTVTKATLDDLVNKNMIEKKPDFLLPKKPATGNKTAIGRVHETKVIEGKK